MSAAKLKAWSRVFAILPMVLPLVGIVLIFLGYSLAYYFRLSPEFGPTANWNTVATVLLVVGVIILLIQLLLCFLGRPENRLIAISSLAIYILSVISCVVFIELVLPASNTIPKSYAKLSDVYTPVQEHLQRQIQGRSQEIPWVFRGKDLNWSTNSFGWPDIERTYTSKKQRVVFIGDSFLESQSSRNLAHLVEDRLADKGMAVDVINLSYSDTNINDYRYRLRELAFAYAPDLVVMFIYAANDIEFGYKFKDYQHDEFLVSEDALLFLRLNIDMPEGLYDELKHLNKTRKTFADKDSFIRILKRFDLSEKNRDFIYLVAYALSSTDESTFPLADLMPTTLIRLTQIWDRIIPGNNTESGWASYQGSYDAIFKLPIDERLGAIAELAAHVNKSNDVKQFEYKLNRLPDAFLDEMLAEPDMTYFLWPAIAEYVLDKPAGRVYRSDSIYRAAAEYEKVIKDMMQYTETHGAKLSVVLIPEASLVDEEFFLFWEPLLDFRSIKYNEHQVMRVLHKKIRSDLEAINLMESGSELKGGYWHFDGHWNDQGNAAVADIITPVILKQLREGRKE